MYYLSRKHTYLQPEKSHFMRRLMWYAHNWRSYTHGWRVSHSTMWKIFITLPKAICMYGFFFLLGRMGMVGICMDTLWKKFVIPKMCSRKNHPVNEPKTMYRVWRVVLSWMHRKGHFDLVFQNLYIVGCQHYHEC